MKVSILCPSRGRPQRLAAMAESAAATARAAQIEILAAVDNDDPMLAEYDRLTEELPFLSIYAGVRDRVNRLFNALAAHATGQILMVAADDVLFRTVGWDLKVEEVLHRFPDGLFIASPMNGDDKVRVNHWFTGRQWCELFGWFMPAHFEHFGDDMWVQEVAKPCGRLVYMQDVLIEHMHAKYGKADNDDTYRSKRMRDPDGSCMSKRDEQLIADLRPQIVADSCKLGRAIEMVAA